MSGKVIDNRNGRVVAPSSLEAWNEFGIREIPLTEALSVRVYQIDVVSWLSKDEGNPLLALMLQSAGEGAAAEGAAPKSNTEEYLKLSDTLDALMVEVMVSPPLKEQGHEDGIPVKRISFGQKLRIFFVLFDQEQLDKLENFRPGQISGVVAGSKGKTIRAETK